METIGFYSKNPKNPSGKNPSLPALQCVPLFEKSHLTEVVKELHTHVLHSKSNKDWATGVQRVLLFIVYHIDLRRITWKIESHRTLTPYILKTNLQRVPNTFMPSMLACGNSFRQIQPSLRAEPRYGEAGCTSQCVLLCTERQS